MDFTSLLDPSMLDQNLLEFTDEASEQINRGRLIQGNPQLAKDQELNKTVLYLGGIGLSAEGLSEDVIKKGRVMTTGDKNEKEWIVFPELSIVVLASKRVRRFYAEVEGNRRLACGTNDDGRDAQGWRGMPCHSCEYFPKNYNNPADPNATHACKASVVVLGYIPELDHTAIFEFRGASYMEATHWLTQVSRLSASFAEKPEIQQAAPGLKRVNSYYFRTVLKAGPYENGNDNNVFQRLSYSKADKPFQWGTLVNSSEIIKKCKSILDELKDVWSAIYIGHNSNAIMALAAPPPVAGALPAQSSAAQAQPAAAPQAQPAAAVAQPTTPPPGTVVTQETQIAANVTKVELDDDVPPQQVEVVNKTETAQASPAPAVTPGF